MAVGNKTGGKDFEKGNPGGPGRPKVSAELKAVKSLSKTMLEKIIAKYAHMSLDDLTIKSNDKSLPMIELTVIKLTMGAYEGGDYKKLDFLLDRTIGKVREVREIVLPEPTYIQRADGTVLELGVENLKGDDDDNDNC